MFVMEYYKDIIWKGSLLFVISLISGIFYFRAAAVGASFLSLVLLPPSLLLPVADPTKCFLDSIYAHRPARVLSSTLSRHPCCGADEFKRPGLGNWAAEPTFWREGGREGGRGTCCQR